MKKLVSFLLIVFIASSCNEDKTIQPFDPVVKSEKQISDLMISLGYSTSPNNVDSSLRLKSNDAVRKISAILIENGFTISENSYKFSNSNSRVESCTYTVFDYDGGGVTGSGTSIVVWECSGSYGNFVSNDIWQNGDLVASNEWYY